MKKQLGDYLLVQQIGYGSLGSTFLASHRFLKKGYVVKVLPQELSSSAMWIERFEEEVEKLGKLSHPHIAKIQGAFCVEDTYALVSEPVSHSVSINQVNLSEEQILDILRSLASSLDAMHSLNVAHGAIKFTNVLLQMEGDRYIPFWSDFGIASLINPSVALSRMYHYVADFLEKEGGVCLSKDGYCQGKWDQLRASALQRSFCERFFFLAPEQKVIGHSEVDARLSDLYAFGVLAYYLLTAEFPQGAFPLPSEKIPSLQYPWDQWICSLLHPDPLARRLGVAHSLEEEVVFRRQVAALQKVKESKVFSGKAQEILAIAACETPSLRPLLRSSEIARPSFDADPASVFQIDTTISTYRPVSSKKEMESIAPVLSEMFVIHEGTYMRGSNYGSRDEMPRHSIVLPPFAIDVQPVTNEQFVLFLEVLGGEKDVQNSDIIRLKDSRIKRSAGKIVIESGYEKHPVVGVTWYGAVAYAKWVGKRLPTEAEWEVAAYGGKEDALYPQGGEIDRTQANFFSSDTTPVGSYPPNGYGLYDMAGNVYEWCQDWYDYHYYDISMQEPNHPKGPSQGIYRVLRGGCWKSSKEDLRCAHRHRNNPGAMNGTYGFRCAADVVQ